MKNASSLRGRVFVLILAISAWRPRFYCRYVCPLGALLGIAARWSLWRMVRRDTDGDAYTGCGRCDHHCEGACAPADRIRWAECALCYNCPDDCPERIPGYATSPSTRGEIAGPGFKPPGRDCRRSFRCDPPALGPFGGSFGGGMATRPGATARSVDRVRIDSSVWIQHPFQYSQEPVPRSICSPCTPIRSRTGFNLT